MSSWGKLLDEAKPESHLVQLYGHDIRCLSKNVGRYLQEGLRQDQGLLIVATSEHNRAFLEQLIADGTNPTEAALAGRFVQLDAHATLAQFMVDGRPDQDRFDRLFGKIIQQIQAPAGATGLRAYGEMVGVLWKAGQFSAALQVEEYWNRLLARNAFSLFCSYPIDVFGREFQIPSVDGILCAHDHLLPSGDDFEAAVDRAMEELLGPRADSVRMLAKANVRPSWAEVPHTEAMILWFRNNLPNHADDILDRARQYCGVGTSPARGPQDDNPLKISALYRSR